MATSFNNLIQLMKRVTDHNAIQKIIEQQDQKIELRKISTKDQYNEVGQLKRLKDISDDNGRSFPYMANNGHTHDLTQLKGNIENFIGYSKVPTGIAGPLLINGTHASGLYNIPLATTEGTLVASYNRGCKAASLAGGIRSIVLSESVQRSPIFRFKNIIHVGKFLAWVVEQYDVFEKITSSCSNYAKLINVKTNIEGNQVNLIFEFSTGDASGQNMVTFCTNEICNYIISNTPIQPKIWYLESNLSGDKKANYQSFQSVRGKKVVAELELPETIVKDVLKSTPQLMEDYWKTSTISLVQLGSIGAQGHIANGLTALFIATGQDVACISEVTVAINRFEVTESGGLYVSLTMPNLIVGTVGGGTSLPTQRECLEMIDCYGSGNSKKFAEVCCALALAGELSIAAAISTGQFAQAHQKFGR